MAYVKKEKTPKAQRINPVHFTKLYSPEKRSQKFGPQIFIEGVKKTIPLGKGGAAVDQGDGNFPQAYKIETMPLIQSHPNRANYYKKYFTHPLIRRACWQFMFGGFLRAVFGVYSPSSLWNRREEQELMEDLKESYLRSKEEGSYGLWSLQVTRNFVFSGKPWKNERPAKGRSIIFPVMKGMIFETRIDRTGSYVKVDMESNNRVYRVNYGNLLRWTVEKKLRRLPDGKIYNLRAGKANLRLSKSLERH